MPLHGGPPRATIATTSALCGAAKGPVAGTVEADTVGGARDEIGWREGPLGSYSICDNERHTIMRLKTRMRGAHARGFGRRLI